MMLRLWITLVPYVDECVVFIDSEGNENHVGLGIRQRSEAVTMLLPCRIPERQGDIFVTELDVFCVIVEHCGDVQLGGPPGGVGNKQACLSAGRHR